MQQPGRGGRGGNNSRSMSSGFPPFPDPFAGFGGRPSFLSDIFDNDPFFSDSFFTRPFGSAFGSGPSLFGSAGGLFEPGGFFNRGLFNEPGAGQEQRNLLDRRAYNGPADGSRRNVPIEEGVRRGVHIEELPDDHDFVGNGQHSSNQEPIVEHPDDDERTDTLDNQPDNSHHQLRTNTSHFQPRSGSRPSRSSSNPVQAYSFQSSSVMYGGANGPYYAAQTTRRQGPEGIIEEECQEKDTNSGKEFHRISHGLHEKGRSFTRKRNAEGREEKFETLHNLGEDDVQDFERTWNTVAEKNLPKWNKTSSQRLGSSSKARPALPSSGTSGSKGQ